MQFLQLMEGITSDYRALPAAALSASGSAGVISAKTGYLFLHPGRRDDRPIVFGRLGWQPRLLSRNKVKLPVRGVTIVAPRIRFRGVSVMEVSRPAFPPSGSQNLNEAQYLNEDARLGTFPAEPALNSDSLSAASLARPLWRHPTPTSMSAKEFSGLCALTALELQARNIFNDVDQLRCRHEIVSSFLSRQEGRPQRIGDVHLLPHRAHGTLFVVFDLHEDYEAFSAALRHSRFAERALAGEDVYIAFVGDYISRGSGGVEILSELFQLYTHPVIGERVFLLKGNHEEDTAATWSVPPKSGDAPVPIIKQRQFLLNFQKKTDTSWTGCSPASLWEDVFSVFRELPCALALANGGVVVHAGLGPAFRSEVRAFGKPRDEEARRRRALTVLTNASAEVRNELLNLRFSEDPKRQMRDRPDRSYIDQATAEKVLNSGGFSVLVRGHQLEHGTGDRSAKALYKRGYDFFGHRVFTGHTITKDLTTASYADAVVAEIDLGQPLEAVDQIKPHTVLRRL